MCILEKRRRWRWNRKSPTLKRMRCRHKIMNGFCSRLTTITVGRTVKPDLYPPHLSQPVSDRIPQDVSQRIEPPNVSAAPRKKDYFTWREFPIFLDFVVSHSLKICQSGGLQHFTQFFRVGGRCLARIVFANIRSRFLIPGRFSFRKGQPLCNFRLSASGVQHHDGVR